MNKAAMLNLRVVIGLGLIMTLSGFDSAAGGLAARSSKDNTPPMVNLGISEPTGNNGWYNAPVSVTVKAFDSGSGIASKQVSIGGKTWYENALVVRQDGTYRVYGRATDRAGNMTTTSLLINVDMTPPELNFTTPDPKGYQGWYVGQVVVRLAGEDGLSGMSATHLLIEGDSISTEVSPWDAQEAYDLDNARTYQQIIQGSNLVQESQANIEQSGVYRASGYVEDLAGNRTYIEQTLRVDRTPPQVSIQSPEKFFGKISIVGSLLDDDSGIHKLNIDVGKGWQQVEPSGASEWQIDWVTDGLRDGKYLIQAWVEDRAGNQAFTYRTVTVLNNIWPVFTIMAVLLSLGLLALMDPRRRAWQNLSKMVAKVAHMEKNAMLLGKEIK